MSNNSMENKMPDTATKTLEILPVQNQSNFKHQTMVNDVVHGLIKLPPLIQQIIDTEQFQRLRNISQLQFCKHVYPSAGHSRFEHSIGTFHLASRLIRQLQEQQKELKKQRNDENLIEITDDDIKCVDVAALCHDLGHGPFSHFWERVFDKSTIKVEHENMSLEVLEDLVKENKIEGLENSIDRIGRIILGKPNEEDSEKKFLFEIVANKRSGLDIDKFDYLCRDTIYLGWSNKNKIHDINRILKFYRIAKVNSEWHLAMRDREIFHIHDIFYYRHLLHRYGYQHKTAVAIDCMIKDGLNYLLDKKKHVLLELLSTVTRKSNIDLIEFVKLKSENIFDPKEVESFKTQFDNAIKNTDKSCKEIIKILDSLFNGHITRDLIISMLHTKEFISICCDNHIWNMLENDEDTGNIIKNIKKRKLYKLMCKLKITSSDPEGKIDKEDVVKKLKNIFRIHFKTPNESKKIKISVHLSKFSLSSEEGNPFDNIPFYEKNNHSEARYFNKPGNLPPSLVECKDVENVAFLFANKIVQESEKNRWNERESIVYNRFRDSKFVKELTLNKEEEDKDEIYCELTEAKKKEITEMKEKYIFEEIKY